LTGQDAEDHAAGYVECSECGHPIERHDLDGCQAAEWCACKVRWTKMAIVKARRRIGLPGRYDPLKH
jgi:RNA polymerase-binding transcription factor DksA